MIKALQSQDRMTFDETLGPAMEMKTQEEADEWFEALVERHTRLWPCPREEAEKSVRSSLGYYAGYYDSGTRERVERLFKCSHPIFGSIEQNGTPTAEEAFQAGLDFAKKA